MPKNKIRATLLINYDPTKDAISITADKNAEPDLAAGGLYVTLKPGTASETLLRSRLMAAGIIKRKTTALTLDQLADVGALKKTDAILLRLLARDTSGILINGQKRDTTALAAAYLEAAGDRRSILIGRYKDQFMVDMLQPLLDAPVYIDASTTEDPTVPQNYSYEDLMRQVYRMRPDFIVQDLYGGDTPLVELPARPGDLHGFIYVDNRHGLGRIVQHLGSDQVFVMNQAISGAQHAGCKAIVQTIPDLNLSNGFKVMSVDIF